MKKIRFVLFFSILSITFWSCSPSSSGGNKKVPQKAAAVSVDSGNHITVLELFTSQGCSSCPPADRLLGTYISKKNVFPVSFHVDYWDRQGWKDPYSSKQFTERQYHYATDLKADVYTPQLIINGQTEMVGSDSAKVASTIQKDMAEQPEATLNIKKATEKDGKVSIEFSASGGLSGAVLNMAVVDQKTTTTVNAGENGGATLTGYNVVRDFATIDKVDSGENSATIQMQPGSPNPGQQVILFLQKTTNNKIVAAAETSLPR